MEIIRFQCAVCGKKIKVAAQFAGQGGACPACRNHFIVPDPAKTVSELPTQEPPVLESDQDGLDDLAHAVAQRQHPSVAVSSSQSNARPVQSDAIGKLPPPIPPVTFCLKCGRTVVSAGTAGHPRFCVYCHSPLFPRAVVPPSHISAQSLTAKASPKSAIILMIVAGCLVSFCLLSAFISQLFVGASRAKADSEVAQLIAQAKEAHDHGKLEEACDLMKRAMAVRGATENLDTLDLSNQYSKEFGHKKEPEVAGMVAAARTAIASNDRPRAISLLKQATDFSLRNAPSYSEAEELLKSVTPSPAPFDSRATAPEVSHGQTNSNSGGPSNAYAIARKFVTDHLKAPATATFPGVWQVDQYSATPDGDVWTVNSYVDAQNSFGANLRNKWTVVIRYNADDTWSLISINIRE
jgi:DNA-directed RNA polymerase subunit RPC12/RpoP